MFLNLFKKDILKTNNKKNKTKQYNSLSEDLWQLFRSHHGADSQFNKVKHT